MVSRNNHRIRAGREAPPRAQDQRWPRREVQEAVARIRAALHVPGIQTAALAVAGLAIFGASWSAGHYWAKLSSATHEAPPVSAPLRAPARGIEKPLPRAAAVAPDPPAAFRRPARGERKDQSRLVPERAGPDPRAAEPAPKELERATPKEFEPETPKEPEREKVQLQAAMDEARAHARLSIPPMDDRQTREMLAWTGHFDAPSDSEADPREAIRRFQVSLRHPETGALSDRERALLHQQGRSRRDAVGYEMVQDAETGVRLGLPRKLVSPVNLGTRGPSWKSADAGIFIQILRIEDGRTLKDLYDKLRRRRDRQIEYEAFRGDWFVLSGQSRGNRFHVRAHAGNGKIRGFSVTYTPRWHDTLQPAVMAMSASFEAFPR